MPTALKQGHHGLGGSAMIHTFAAALAALVLVASAPAFPHGGGLNACGCHFNRKTGAGELRTDLVYESPEAIAFLDKHPVARGHALVIPRAHAPTLLELEDGSIGGGVGAVKAPSRKNYPTPPP